MRFTILLTALVATTTFAAPTPLVPVEGFGKAQLSGRTLASEIISTLLALLSKIEGGSGSRGGRPTVSIPSGTTTIKATTLAASTVAATTLPATTLAATTIGTLTTIAATTAPATTLAASTVPATTISATVITIASGSASSSAVSSSLTTAAAVASSSAASAAVALDCTVSSTTLPSAATALPTPTGTFVGSFTGVGTQNYNCTGLNSTAAPVAIGANADLTSTAGCGTGVHSFDNPTSPRFNMVDLGNTLASKVASIASPDGATNVAWLSLNAVDSTGGIVQVYRVETQNGVAPATCGTDTGVINVDYQAQYFFYQG